MDRDWLALVLVTLLLSVGIGHTVAERGVVHRIGWLDGPDTGESEGHTHWSEDPNITSADDVPPDYYGPLPEKEYDIDIEGRVTMRPNLSVWWVGNDYRTPGTLVETNRYGLRDDPFPVEPRPGELRIVALGDSNTFGEGLNLSETWPQQLEASLSTEMDAPVQVINGGVKGFSTREMYLQLRDVMLRFDPDLVVMTVSVGDDMTEPDHRQLSQRIDQQHPNMSDEDLRDELRDALRQYGRGIGERWDRNESTVRTYLRRTERLLEREGVPWTIYRFRGEPRALPQRIGRFSEEHEVPYIRPHPRLRHSLEQYTILPQDGHLNAEGNRLYAEKVEEGLRDRFSLSELAGDG